MEITSGLCVGRKGASGERIHQSGEGEGVRWIRLTAPRLRRAAAPFLVVGVAACASGRAGDFVLSRASDPFTDKPRPLVMLMTKIEDVHLSPIQGVFFSCDPTGNGRIKMQVFHDTLVGRVLPDGRRTNVLLIRFGAGEPVELPGFTVQDGRETVVWADTDDMQDLMAGRRLAIRATDSADGSVLGTKSWPGLKHGEEAIGYLVRECGGPDGAAGFGS